MVYTFDEFLERQEAWRLAGEAWRLEGERAQPVVVPRACGHDEEMMLPLRAYGKSIDLVMSQACKACRDAVAARYDAKYAGTDVEIADRAEDWGLPPLEGTSRQVRWAMRIRDEAVREHGIAAMQVLTYHKEAAWWIGNRESLYDLSQEAQVPLAEP